jgi:hypothetical protein
MGAKKPRARKGNKEVELPPLKKLQDRDLLDRQIYSRIMLDVSSRNYEEVIGGLAKKTGIKRSSVSRAFIRASVKDLDSINGADLSTYRFVGILIDGTNLDSIQGWLATISSEAETSLLEAGEALLTVHNLGIVGTFRKILTATNIIESVMGATKEKTRKVKNWGYHLKTGNNVKRNKILRWVSSAICSHQPKMKKINGTNGQFATLIQSLINIALNKKLA